CARFCSAPVSRRSEVAGSRVSAGRSVCETLTPIPSTTRPSLASASTPATLRPPTSTSFGCLSSGASPVCAAIASATAIAATAVVQPPTPKRRRMAQPLRQEEPLRYERLSDPILVRRAKDGDRRALEALCERHAPRVEKLAGHLLRDREDARDAAQESLAKLC